MVAFTLLGRSGGRGLSSSSSSSSSLDVVSMEEAEVFAGGTKVGGVSAMTLMLMPMMMSVVVVFVFV